VTKISVAVQNVGPEGRKMRRSKLLIKILLAVVVFTGLGFLFIRSVRDAGSEPYTVSGEHLRNWTLVLESTSDPRDPLLALRAPPGLANGIFRQVFLRVMETMDAPSDAVIPLLLQGEFDRAFAGRVTPDALMAAARNAGLDSSALVSTCVGHRRVSAPNITQQLYFVLFDSPAFDRFRAGVGSLLDVDPAARSAFDPGALSPVMFIGLSNSTVNSWLPLRADPKTDCVAPIATSSAPPT
jgi:hypothetical protein